MIRVRLSTDVAQLAGGRPAHRDVVLLHRGGRDRVHRGGDGEPLHLADQGGLGVLGDHQPGVDARVVGEEGRQAVRAVLVQQPVGAALGDRGQVGGGDGEEVQHVADGGAVEVAVGLDPADPGALVRAVAPDDHRVVDGGGQFAVGDQAGVREGVAAGAGDLRGAAHGVRVLDPGGVVLVVAGQAGTRQYPAHVVGAGRLAGVRADGVQFGRQHLVGAEQRLQGEGGGDVGGGEERARSAQAITSMPSMPSVPLMRARPSFSRSSTGSMPCSARSSAAGRTVTVGALGLALAHQHLGAVRRAARGRRSSRASRTRGRPG